MITPINFYSTNLNTSPVSFSKALLKGLAPDKGLFMPEEIPEVSKEEIQSFRYLSYHEIAYEIGKKFLVGEIPDEDLRWITKDAYDYEVPLEHVYENKYIMRLDQGPTASFKDFAARMMGRLMQYYLKKEKRNLIILTATSGDTGSAIANAFYGLDNIRVLVLFPEKEVTERQRKQMTTLGDNIQIIAIDGKFDDCQALVKEAFTDPDLADLNLSSANSINIGRLIPQIVYYFYAFSRLSNDYNKGVIFSVPSGNFGDMMGGFFAKRMGLLIKRFIIAVNENDEFQKYIQTGIYNKIDPSINCISSAMNVGHPSNLARLVALYGGVMDEKGNIRRQANLDSMRQDIFAISINDKDTRKAIKDAYEQYNIILEPHGAVGWAGLQIFLKLEGNNYRADQLYVSLETAHPAKFPEEIKKILDLDPELPASLEGLEGKDENFDLMDDNYTLFKNYLTEKYK